MVAYWKAQNGSDDDYEVASTEGFDDIESVEQGKTKFDYTVTFDEPNAEWPLYIYPRLAANVSKSPSCSTTASGPGRSRPTARSWCRRSTPARARSSRSPTRAGGARSPSCRRSRSRSPTPGVLAKAFAAGELDAVDLEANTYTIASEGQGRLDPARVRHRVVAGHPQCRSWPAQGSRRAPSGRPRDQPRRRSPSRRRPRSAPRRARSAASCWCPASRATSTPRPKIAHDVGTGRRAADQGGVGEGLRRHPYPQGQAADAVDAGAVQHADQQPPGVADRRRTSSKVGIEVKVRERPGRPSSSASSSSRSTSTS